MNVNGRFGMIGFSLFGSGISISYLRFRGLGLKFWHSLSMLFACLHTFFFLSYKAHGISKYIVLFWFSLLTTAQLLSDFLCWHFALFLISISYFYLLKQGLGFLVFVLFTGLVRPQYSMLYFCLELVTFTWVFTSGWSLALCIQVFLLCFILSVFLILGRESWILVGTVRLHKGDFYSCIYHHIFYRNTKSITESGTGLAFMFVLFWSYLVTHLIMIVMIFLHSRGYVCMCR